MDENALPKPRMPRIKNFPFLGPVGVMLSSCITRPERISRSTRIARRPGPYTDPLQARLSRSQRSVDYIIATSAALRELLRPPNGHADFRRRGSFRFARDTNAMPSENRLRRPGPHQQHQCSIRLMKIRIPIFTRALFHF
jgi:hypothetical protein